MGNSQVDFLGPEQVWTWRIASTQPVRVWGKTGCGERASTIFPESFLAIQTQMKTACALWPRRLAPSPAQSLLRRVRTLVSFAAVKGWRVPAVSTRGG